jgi:hypothetical protein
VTLAAQRSAVDRGRLVRSLERRVAIEVGRYFRSSWSRIAPGIRRVLEREVGTKADEIGLDLSTISWDQERRILERIIRRVLSVVVDDASELAGTELGISQAFDLPQFGLDQVIPDLGRRIRAITETSRERIARACVDGLERGLSVEQIVQGTDSFPGIRNLVDSWSSTGTAPFLGRVGTVPLPSSRAYLIALTETGNAFNKATLERYERSLVDVVEVFDGPECGWTEHDDPDLANRSLRTVDQAKAHPLAHPRCQRAFGARVDLRTPTTTPPANAALARERALETAADRIRTNPDFETAIVVDDAGNVLLDKSDGAARSVGFGSSDLAKARGATITHNHPVAYQEGLLHATSLSPNDVDLLLESGAKEIRAVGKGADYIMRVTEAALYAKRAEILGYARRAETEVRAAAMPAIRAAEDRAAEILRAGRTAASTTGGGFDVRLYAEAQAEATRVVRTAVEEAERLHFHRVWTIVSAQYPGLDYRQILRPEKL